MYAQRLYKSSQEVDRTDGGKDRSWMKEKRRLGWGHLWSLILLLPSVVQLLTLIWMNKWKCCKPQSHHHISVFMFLSFCHWKMKTSIFFFIKGIPPLTNSDPDNLLFNILSVSKMILDTQKIKNRWWNLNFQIMCKWLSSNTCLKADVRAKSRHVKQRK